MNDGGGLRVRGAAGPPGYNSGVVGGAGGVSGSSGGIGNGGNGMGIGGNALSDLNVQCTRLQMELDGLLHPELLNNRFDAKKQDDDECDAIGAKLDEFLRNLDTMERLAGSERNMGQRRVWTERLRQYRQRYGEFDNKLDAKRRRRAQTEEQARAKLFAQSNGAQPGMGMQSDEVAISTALDSSINIAEQALQQGAATLEGLKRQGTVLKKAQEGILQIANVLGLSNSLLGVIERREWGDKMIVYGGVAFVLVFLYFVYYMTG